jgi:tetratricopeptide (TPR) repeat protein
MAAADHESPAPRPEQLWSDPALISGLVLFGVLFVLALKSGGTNPTVWYPGALLVLALAAVVLAGRLRAGLRFPLPVLIAFGALTVYAVIAYASITWSHAKGLAWDGANLTFAYLAVYVTATALPWRRATVAAVLGLYGLGVAAAGVIELARAASASDPTASFQLGRFAAPFGYQNGACCWYLMAVWPLLLLASRREVPIALRAVSSAGLCVLPELGLLCQSRASIVAAAITGVAYLAFVPGRSRALVTAIAPAVLLASVHGRLLDVYPAIKDGDGVRHAVAAARNAVLLSAVIGLLVGLALAVADRRLTSPRLRRGISQAVAGGACLGALAALAAGAYVFRHPEARLHRAWHDFKVTQPSTRASYFSIGLGGNRYDIWRVALDEFTGAPAVGVGVDNFAADYLEKRRSQEEPLYPHSLELRLLSQTGVVGTIAFAAFLAALAAALTRLRRASRSQQAVAGAALATAVYWFAQGSVDWFWETPALGGLAFACLGAATSLAARPRAREAPSRAVRESGTAAIALVAVLAGLSCVFPWLAAEETDRAALIWRHDPQTAYSRLHTAARLNPLSDEPKLVEGAIASRRGDIPRLRDAFRAALRRDPRDWYAHLELGVAASLSGDRAGALRELQAAHELDPLEPTIGQVTDDVRAGRKVSPHALDELFLARIHL